MYLKEQLILLNYINYISFISKNYSIKFNMSSYMYLIGLLILLNLVK